ncbi:DUF1287 domain-containing protein [Candidatus Albibeggiatoa sp. nov. BB20]|uniref:DUF1287 domain-containing protein n=1 Tax=Candidatus Albibeggiatoa sp. nov. BB20 TaxID=3162723 RepID=UPI0033659D16
MTHCLRYRLFLLLAWCCVACQAELPTAKVVNPQIRQLLQGAEAQIGKTLSYDPNYRKLDYPGGDVPLETGVCTDVVIRAFRAVDLDLQVLVHKDMRKAFSKYPNHWGLKTTDHNIDHRRVYNLQTFFKRQGAALPISQNPNDYLPGDLVTWMVSPENLPHIGIVAWQKTRDSKRWLIIHNIGRGAQKGDILFKYKITGHYRYFVAK